MKKQKFNKMKIKKTSLASSFLYNKNKLILTIVITFIWLFLVTLLTPNIPCNCGFSEGSCLDYGNYLIIKNSCYCGCIGLNEVFKQHLFNVIIPFLFIYSLKSFDEFYGKKKNWKNLPTWVKGGLIGEVICLPVVIIFVSIFSVSTIISLFVTGYISGACIGLVLEKSRK